MLRPAKVEINIKTKEGTRKYKRVIKMIKNKHLDKRIEIKHG